ncbi:MAG: sarcosine oxidase subunit gamma [Rhizobiaceae bacterium]|nr:sarcosine oxidase subunit gamma [Rhizobiaceae bacterium]
MAKANVATRDNPTSGNRLANASVSIESAPPASRISFRATPKGAKDFGKTLDLDLPVKPGQSTSKSTLSALWIGPDEWLIIDTKNPIDKLMPRRENANFCATDISHRNVAFIVSGNGAENTLCASCPRDLSLSAFPVGSASRTIFGKAEVVLLRTGKTSFRLECWRSFSPYVWDLLVDGAHDAHI